MTTPAIHRLTDELLAAIAQQKALHDDATVIPFGRCRARKRVFDLADALAAEKAKPMTEVIAPWSPWNGIVRTGPSTATPDSSVGTPGGREL